jgi:hypothetical protein
MYRAHQYEMMPLRLEITGHILPAALRVEYDDEDGLNFMVAASELLEPGTASLKSIHLVVRHATLTNTTSTTLRFRLSSPSPFDIIQMDRVTGQPMQRLNRTDLFSLEPRQNAVMHVAFCATPDLLNNLHLMQFFDGRSSDGVELHRLDNERRLLFFQDVTIEFDNQSVQMLPLTATLVVPSLKLTSSINGVADFGTCFIGQTREMQVVLSNLSISNSFWKCRLETKSDNCTSDTFVVSPTSGLLQGQTSFLSDNKAVIHIYFTATSCETYTAEYVLEGILGEEPCILRARGCGSYDGRFEVILNV